ncbi:hypothetical protein A9Q93_02440 [Nonlabens dokdonensis]|uniref:Lipoprotein n=1 Tax=Nonlabens dokdonensis TaxID=328515 RepID=A0A1Z8B9K9_9FLAO|nr:hypothetical protein [Nonlabens dokdonensis]OUS19253.1 hypothetical protein A9Q93_02440 [Nonlabens dokdonensis]
MKFKLSLICICFILLIACKDSNRNNELDDNEVENTSLTDKAKMQDALMYKYCSILESELQITKSVATHNIAETGLNVNVGLIGTFYMDTTTNKVTKIDFTSKNGFKNVKTATFEIIDGEYALKIVLYKSAGTGNTSNTINGSILNDTTPNKDFKTIIYTYEDGLECFKRMDDTLIPLKKGHSFKRPSINSGN